MHTMTATRHVHHGHAAFNPLRWIANAVTTYRQRQMLASLDAHMLEDIGIDPATARSEVKRPFWDLPR